MMSEIATRRVQLPIDECKDWILHALEIKEQYYRTIRYAADKKWEFLIVDCTLLLLS
jgi:hypothetical protein